MKFGLLKSSIPVRTRPHSLHCPHRRQFIPALSPAIKPIRTVPSPSAFARIIRQSPPLSHPRRLSDDSLLQNTSANLAKGLKRSKHQNSSLFSSPKKGSLFSLSQFFLLFQPCSPPPCSAPPLAAPPWSAPPLDPRLSPSARPSSLLGRSASLPPERPSTLRRPLRSSLPGEDRHRRPSFFILRIDGTAIGAQCAAGREECIQRKEEGKK